MQIRNLHISDGPALLAFERSNRTWFEQLIPPRPEATFSASGMLAHIRQYLDDQQRGILHPCVLLGVDGKIVGRANLRAIDRAGRTAEIGYRIAHAHIGAGLASAAVVHLKQLAQVEWHLTRLTAYVTTDNLASARVLQKSGFTRTGQFFPGMTVLKDKVLDCFQYEHWLPGAA
jgi:ribosomal-protein-alanine N-acetyltransferase